MAVNHQVGYCLDRRRFLEFAGGAAIAGAVALTGYEFGHEFLARELYNLRDGNQESQSEIQTSQCYTCTSNATLTKTSESQTSTLSSILSAKQYSLTLTPFIDYHGDGKQQKDEPLYSEAKPNSGLSLIDTLGNVQHQLPDKDGSFKFEVDEGINYGVKFDNLLYRYVTPSNADLSTIYDFKLKIDPDNLEVNFPITVGPHTWPTRFTGNQDSCGNTAQKGERCVEAYQDISKGFNGAPYGGAVRDWMDGHNVIDNHWGTDINIDAGTPELASAPGKVIETVENWPNQQGSFFYGFYSDADAKVLYQDSGKLVCIDHDVIDSSSGYHLYTMSTHLNGVSVKVGDFVKRGQQIGTCGTTGRTYNHPENDFIQFGSKNGSLWAPDMYAYRGDPNSISYWTKKSNPQQPNDPQSPIPD